MMLSGLTEVSIIQHDIFEYFMNANVCLVFASEWLPSEAVLIAMA